MLLPHSELAWQRRGGGVFGDWFFENDGYKSIMNCNQMSGNPVRIGDGCATVTGYEFPQPLVSKDREGGNKVKARSQDTGLVVLVGPFAVNGQLLRQREG